MAYTPQHADGTPDPAKTISPKVIASTIAAFAVPAVIALIDSVTIEMLASLGQWQGPVHAAIGALSAAIAGWWARDPLRG